MPFAAVINPASFLPLGEPLVEKITITNNGYYRSVLLKEEGTMVPQHKHDLRHDTFVCNGKARGWANGVCMGDRDAGEAFEVEVGVDHTFLALEPNTRLACIYTAKDGEVVEAKGH